MPLKLFEVTYLIKEHTHFKLTLLFKKFNLSKHQPQDTQIIWQLSYLPRNDMNIYVFLSWFKMDKQANISPQWKPYPNVILILSKLQKEGRAKGMHFLGGDEFLNFVPVYIRT